MAESTRVSFDELKKIFLEKLVKHGVGEDEAEKTAGIFALNAADGIMTHSVERFPRLIRQIDDGVSFPGRVPELVASFGAIEKYDACLGLGTTSASLSMDRAEALASEYGIGLVALRNASHWMRAGFYALSAAEKGFVGICWTNTMHNLPAWGSCEANIGNNPVSMAVPREDGRHFLIDSAMSQFSVGKISQSAEKGVRLPVAGGYDRDGNLTDNPSEILASWRLIPAGFWKGSGFSILLDAMASILSDGKTVSEIGNCDAVHEAGLSQVFIAVDYRKLGNDPSERVLSSIEDSLRNAARVNEKNSVRYPGENLKSIREKSIRDGMTVSSRIMDEINSL